MINIVKVETRDYIASVKAHQLAVGRACVSYCIRPGVQNFLLAGLLPIITLYPAYFKIESSDILIVSSVYTIYVLVLIIDTIRLDVTYTLPTEVCMTGLRALLG